MIGLNQQKFSRYSGIGNSFIITHDFLLKENRKEFAKRICQSVDGLSADGFICLEEFDKDNLDFKWDFYNSDGSIAEMCGNAARCAALYYFNKIKKKSKLRFGTISGVVESEIINVDENIVRIQIPKIENFESPKIIKIHQKELRGFFVNSGVPHFILETEPDLELAKKIRSASEFGSQGSNVTFVERDEDNYLQAITFERGVENFTLGCGTGAIAAAFYYKTIQNDLKSEVEDVLVEMPGGVLAVEFKSTGVYLTGTVECQFDFQIYGAIN